MRAQRHLRLFHPLRHAPLTWRPQGKTSTENLSWTSGWTRGTKPTRQPSSSSRSPPHGRPSTTRDGSPPPMQRRRGRYAVSLSRLRYSLAQACAAQGVAVGSGIGTLDEIVSTANTLQTSVRAESLGLQPRWAPALTHRFHSIIRAIGRCRRTSSPRSWSTWPPVGSALLMASEVRTTCLSAAPILNSR